MKVKNDSLTNDHRRIQNLAEPMTIDAYKNLAGFFRTRLITK